MALHRIRRLVAMFVADHQKHSAVLVHCFHDRPVMVARGNHINKSGGMSSPARARSVSRENLLVTAHVIFSALRGMRKD